MLPKLIKNPKNGNLRISQACDRCRIKKIKCDGSLPACSNCLKIGFLCKTLDKLTRRSFPKGYTENLERNLIFLQNENLKLASYVKSHIAGKPNTDVMLALNRSANFDVLVDSLENSAVSQSPPSGGTTGSAAAPAFASVFVNGTSIGKNLLNMRIYQLLTMLSSSYKPFLVQTPKRNSETSPIPVLLDLVFFRMLLESRGSTIALSERSVSLMDRCVERFFSRYNALGIVDEVGFFTCFARLKKELTSLVEQYNAVNHGTKSSSSIRKNETSLSFKLVLLMVVFLGNQETGLRLPYDYELLKHIIGGQTGVSKEGNASERLQMLLLFLHISLGRNHHEPNPDGSNGSNFAQIYLENASENVAYLTTLVGIVNSAVVSALVPNLPYEHVLPLLESQSKGVLVCPETAFSSPETDSALSAFHAQNRRARLYWAAYVLNSAFAFRTGNYDQNQLLKSHYNGELKIPSLEALADTDVALRPSLDMVRLFLCINDAVFNQNGLVYEGKPISCATTENEIELLPKVKLQELSSSVEELFNKAGSTSAIGLCCLYVLGMLKLYLGQLNVNILKSFSESAILSSESGRKRRKTGGQLLRGTIPFDLSEALLLLCSECAQNGLPIEAKQAISLAGKDGGLKTEWARLLKDLIGGEDEEFGSEKSVIEEERERGSILLEKSESFDEPMLRLNSVCSLFSQKPASSISMGRGAASMTTYSEISMKDEEAGLYNWTRLGLQGSHLKGWDGDLGSEEESFKGVSVSSLVDNIISPESYNATFMVKREREKDLVEFEPKFGDFNLVLR